MKKKILLILCVAFTLNLKAQIKADIGGFLGASYYFGNLNPSTHFYSPSIAGGAIYKYNFTNRFALRLSVLSVKLTAKDADFKDLYQQYRNYSMNQTIVDLGTQIEFNFLPFTLSKIRDRATPYVMTGLAGFFSHSPNMSAFQICLPLGVGFKFALNDKYAIGVEYSIRRTFTPYLDGITDKTPFSFSPKQNVTTMNNDWYFLTGIVLSYKFYNGVIKCKAYQFTQP